MADLSVPFEISKEDIRSFIKLCSLLDESATDIHRKLVQIMANDAPALRTVQDWASRFRHGRASVSDDPRSGRPADVTSGDFVDRVENLVAKDPWISIEEIASTLSISHGSVFTILHENLRLKKLCDRWVPHRLTDTQKEERVDCATALLNKMRRWGREGIKNIVSGDESYFHYFEPEHRLERMAWRHSHDPPPTTSHPPAFAEKVLYTFFITCEGELARVVAPKGTRVSGEYYIKTILPKVVGEFRNRRPGQKMRLHDDNAAPHRSHKVLEFLEDENVERIPHPPYSPDLSPCDFWLFPKIKAELRGKQFSDRKALGGAIGMVMQTISPSDYSDCFQMWKNRLKLCVQHAGDYFEALH